MNFMLFKIYGKVFDLDWLHHYRNYRNPWFHLATEYCTWTYSSSHFCTLWFNLDWIWCINTPILVHN